MAYQTTSDGIVATFEAGADLSGDQFKIVKLDANGNVIRCAATTDLAIGVLQNKPTSGQAATVLIAGISKVVANTNFALPNTIGVSGGGAATEGRATAQAGNAANPVIGHALEAPSGAGSVFTASINCLATCVTS